MLPQAAKVLSVANYSPTILQTAGCDCALCIFCDIDYIRIPTRLKPNFLRYNHLDLPLYRCYW